MEHTRTQITTQTSDAPVSTDVLSGDGPVYAELSHFGLLEFTGDDVQSFLQGQLSCDVNALQRNHAVYGSYNSPKGRMFASFLLWRQADGYMMQLPRSLCLPVSKRLSMYVLRSRVKIEDKSAALTLLGVTGDGAELALQQTFKTVPSSPLTITTSDTVQVLRLDDTRFELIMAFADAQRVQGALANEARAISEAVWDRTNLHAGVPYITPATQDQFVPQMVNIDLIGGVSFNKGCYPGQEIVARMHYLGKLKQRMYLANIDSDAAPQPGDKLYSPETGDQAAGMIVNAAPAAGRGHDVLAVMPIADAISGKVRWSSLAGPPLTLLPLPYPVTAAP